MNHSDLRIGMRVKLTPRHTHRGQYDHSLIGLTFEITAIYNKSYHTYESSGRTTQGKIQNLSAEDIMPVKITTLYGYTDKTDEVHWSTRKYSETEAKRFGFTFDEKFNKVIELE